MHSEAMSNHDLMDIKLEGMRERCEEKGNEATSGYMDTLLGSEGRHRGILERFGRYPYRNGAVGREETAEEREWLRGGGDTFGTDGVRGN